MTKEKNKAVAASWRSAKRKVSTYMTQIENNGLRWWVDQQRISIRGFARLINVPASTVDNWLKVKRISKVAKMAIEGGLIKRYFERYQ